MQINNGRTFRKVSYLYSLLNAYHYPRGAIFQSLTIFWNTSSKSTRVNQSRIHAPSSSQCINSRNCQVVLKQIIPRPPSFQRWEKRLNFHNSVQISMQIRVSVGTSCVPYINQSDKLREQDRPVFTRLYLMTANFEGIAPIRVRSFGSERRYRTYIYTYT